MRKKLFLTGALFVLGILIVFPHSAHSQLKPGDPIILGAPAALGFKNSAEGLQAAIMAVEEINAKGGVSIKGAKHPLKIESQDTRDMLPGVPVSEALLGVEKIILEKKAHAIVVSPQRSEAFVASMDLVAKYKVPMLSAIAMTPVVEKKVLENYDKYKYVFRVCINSGHFADNVSGIAGFFNKEFGFKKAYLSAQDVLWARGTITLLEEWLKKGGWEISGKDFFPTGASDFSTSLMKVKGTKAQVIIPIFDMPEGGILVKQWSAMEVQAVMAGNISPLAHPGAWDTFEGKVDGFLQSVHEVGNIPVKAIPKSVEFYEAFKKRWGKEIDIEHGVSPSYDSVYILAKAIERAGSVDPDALVVELEKTDHMGAIGRIRFDKKSHQAIYGLDPKETAMTCMFQWQKPGKRVVVYPQAIAEGKIQLPPGLKPAK